MASRFSRALACTTLLGLLVACSNDDFLPDPTVANVVDTLTLFAVEGTPVGTPSGYSIIDGQAVRIDQRPDFDFVYGLPAGVGPSLLPPGALGLAQNLSLRPGILEPSDGFDDLEIAQLNGYRTEDTISVAIGQTFVARSRVACGLGVPMYAKLRILSIDPLQRSVTLETLPNRNCGYRGLQPGLPDA